MASGTFEMRDIKHGSHTNENISDAVMRFVAIAPHEAHQDEQEPLNRIQSATKGNQPNKYTGLFAPSLVS